MDCFRAIVWKAELSKESLIQIFVRAEAEDPHQATDKGFFGICLVRRKSVLFNWIFLTNMKPELNSFVPWAC